MFGRRLRNNSAGASEGLNSDSRITSEGRTTLGVFRNRVLPYMLASSIMGATMTQPRQVDAQERTVQTDVRALQAVAADIGTQLNSLRQTLTTMQGSGMPAQVGATDASVRRLAELCVTNAQSLGIPVTGSTPEERFRSINDWLNSSWHGRAGLSGRNRDSPIDSAALDELEFRLNVASGRPVVSGADAMLAVLRNQAPPSTAPPAAAAQQAQTEAARTAVDRLQVLAEYGRTQQVRADAGRRLTALNRELERQTPNQSAIDRLVRDDNTNLINKRIGRGPETEYTRAEQRMNESRASANQTATGQPHPLSSDINSLYSTVQGMSGPVAENIRRRIPDVWLLGETEMRQMFDLLRQAQQALASGNEAQANQRLADATTLFDREQTLYARFLERYVAPVARGSLSEAQGSSLLSRQELERLETRFHQPRHTYYGLPVYDDPVRRTRVVRYVSNAKDDVVRALDGRMSSVTALQGRTGRIPYRMVMDLYTAASTDASTIHTVLSMWEDARTAGIDTSQDADKIYTAFARATAVITDPNFDPFALYARDQQVRLVRDFLGLAPGAAVSDAQLRSGANQLAAQLRRNGALRYDYDVLYPVFESVVGMRQPSAEQPLQQLSQIRAIRFGLQREYLPYQIVGIDPVIPGLTADQVSQLPMPRRNEYRFRLSRDYLQTAVTTLTQNGMRADDPLLVSANAWLAATQTAPGADRMVATADALYNITLSLISIREAEMWAGNASFRSSSVSAATVTAANAVIAEARRSFQWNYSQPSIDPAFHFNAPRNIADGAIRMLVPRSFLTLEASGMYYSRGGYDNPTLPQFGGATLAGAEATTAEHLHGAAVAEQRFLSYVIANRDSSNFSPSIAETTIGQNGMAAAMNALSISVGRVPPRAETVVPITQQAQGVDPNFPTYDDPNGTRRWRPTINPLDDHAIPMQNPANTNLATVHHEDTVQYPFGQLYVELYRLALMHQDSATPEALRSLNVPPDQYPIRNDANFRAQDTALRARLQAIAREYGLPTDRPLLVSLRERMYDSAAGYSTREPGAQLQDSNRLMLAVLDFRIAELESRLSGKVRCTDGQYYDARDVVSRAGTPRPPGVYYVVRAQEMLEDARTARRSLAAATDSDMLSGRVTVRQAIAIAEMGISSMDHIMPPPVQPPIPEYTVNARIEPERLSGNPTRMRFRALDVSVQEAAAQGQRQPAAVPLQQYEQRHGAQNLTYYWFIYQRTGRRDDNNEEIQYLLNPRYQEANQPRYVGQVMRGARVRMTDGSVQTGDFIVRVRQGFQPSTGPYFVPIREADGTVRVENVLCRVNVVVEGDSVQPKPVRDDLFRQRLAAEHFAMERQSPADTVVEYGPTTPVLVISPNATTQGR